MRPHDRGTQRGDGRAVAVPSECGGAVRDREGSRPGHGDHTVGATLRVSGRSCAVAGRSSSWRRSATARRVPPLGRRAMRRPAYRPFGGPV